MPDRAIIEAADWSAGESAGAADERAQLIWHGVTNCSGFIISALAGMVLVPIMIGRLSRSSYGLWIAMESAAAMLARVDLGLTWAVTREVAARAHSPNPELVPFLSAAAKVYLLIGLAGWLGLAALGGPIGRALGVGPHLAAVLFAVGGAVFFFEILRIFAISILHGLRRFDLANAVAGGFAVLWAGGAIALLLGGAGLITVVVWQALSSATATALALLLVRRDYPRWDLGLGWPDLTPLGGHLGFSVTSQLATVTGGAIWEIPALLIGALLGAPQIVPYYVGRMLPSAASTVGWRLAQVLYPAASQSERAGDRAATRALIETGTRWNIVTMLPICIVLWVTGPSLIGLWTGSASPETVSILRIMVMVELCDTPGLGAGMVLWGSGAAKAVLAVDVAILVAVSLLCAYLIPWIGATGAAIALLAPVAAGNAVCLVIASRRFGFSATGLMRSVANGLVIPAAACFVAALLVKALAPPGSWTEIVTVSGASGFAYMAVLRFRGARPEELEVLAALESPAWHLARSVRRRLAGS